MVAINRAADEQRLKDQNTFLSTAATLSNAKNKELAAIGKAAAILQIAIATPPAVAGSYKFGALIGGPITGAVFAGIASVAMAAQAAQIAGVQFADGGIVGGNSFSGDMVSARLNSGEMVLNRMQQGKLFSMANGDGGGDVVGAITALGDRIAGMNIVVQANSREIARLVRDERAAGFAV